MFRDFARIAILYVPVAAGAIALLTGRGTGWGGTIRPPLLWRLCIFGLGTLLFGLLLLGLQHVAPHAFDNRSSNLSPFYGAALVLFWWMGLQVLLRAIYTMFHRHRGPAEKELD